jgi:hypothetical protein
MTFIYTAVASLVVAILAGVGLDYIRNARSRVIYSVKDAVPISLEDKSVGAYVFALKNTSKRTVKDVECHLQSYLGSLKLRNGGIAAPQGMKYRVEENDNNFSISIPFLNSGEGLTATIIAEGSYVPAKLDAAVRSAHELKVVQTDLIENDRRQRLSNGLLSSSFVAVIASVSATALMVYSNVLNTPADILTFAATASNLPQLAERYATGPDSLHYYSQGDLACALAASAAQPAEIEKYRKFLSLALQLSSGMQMKSQANLYYCRGKLDVLLKDNESAKQDFKQAINHSSSLVSTKISVEPAVRDFLDANGLH